VKASNHTSINLLKKKLRSTASLLAVNLLKESHALTEEKPDETEAR
jgi:hypothetical protein